MENCCLGIKKYKVCSSANICVQPSNHSINEKVKKELIFPAASFIPSGSTAFCQCRANEGAWYYHDCRPEVPTPIPLAARWQILDPHFSNDTDTAEQQAPKGIGSLASFVPLIPHTGLDLHGPAWTSWQTVSSPQAVNFPPLCESILNLIATNLLLVYH